MSCSKPASKLESMLKCGVCGNTVEKPKTLTCFHSFCGSCIAQLRSCSVAGESGVHCPLCNAFSCEKYVQPSFLMKQLLDKYLKSKCWCQQCKENDSKWKCVECQLYLCQKCKSHHHIIPTCRFHQIIDKGSDEEIVVDSQVFCSLHPDEQVMFNCKDCEVPLCIQCKVTQHETHKTETIEDTLQRLLPEVKANIGKLQNHIVDLDQELDILSSKIEQVKDAFTKCKHEAGNNLNEAIVKMKAEHLTIIKQLEAKEEEVVSKLQVASDEIDRKKKEISQVCEWVGTSIEAARGVTLMTELQAGLYKNVLKATKIEPRNRLLVYIPKIKENKEEMTGTIGTVSYNYISIPSKGQRSIKAKVESFQDIFTRELNCKDNIPLPGEASRMGMVNGNIWLPLPHNNIIHVYNQEGELIKIIKHENNPRSADQAVNGDIILASNNGLEVISEDGEVIICLKEGQFCDVSVDWDEFAALNYVTHEISVWKHDDVSGVWKQMSCFNERNGYSHPSGTVLYFNDIVYAIPHYGNNAVDEYTANGVFIKQHTPRNPDSLFICGNDTNGDFIVANFNKQEFLFLMDNFESVDLCLQGKPYDIMYARDSETVWVLQYDNAYCSTKYN